MRFKHLIGLIILAVVISLLSFWLAMNRITFIFSIAAVGYPQNWGYVVLNAFLISLFLVFIKFRRKVARLPSSVYLAFIVALYIEMYGFPLTMYFFAWFFGYENAATLWYFLVELTGFDLFVYIYLGVILPISNIMILAGVFLIIFGWSKIFRAKNTLVTTGIYSHVRHPQYLGFLLLTFGIAFLWPTFSTIILWPILALLYYKLAKEEEKILEEKFGKEYKEYKNNVPMFIPRLWKKDNR
ncbi:MAG: methyltransferase family protein [Candidatus Bathyarchaeales archaeon]